MNYIYLWWNGIYIKGYIYKEYKEYKYNKEFYIKYKECKQMQKFRLLAHYME